MEISKFGGEFKLIDAIVKHVKDPGIIKDYGDDAAVIKTSDPKVHQLISTDMFTDGNHFSTKYFSPLEIGYKVSEATLSDIAAMGGKPKYMFISICLRKNLQIAYLRSLYRGIYNSCSHHKVLILGGDTVRNNKISCALTAVGEVSTENLCLRSSAKVGDIVKVTGELGGSNAGFIILKREYLGHRYIKKKHLQPRCRLDLVDKIAPLANAMIDVSDGIAGDLKHICDQSGVGAEIIKQDIPISKQVIHAARALKMNPHNFAIYGGEDFELLYTVPEENAKKTPGTTIGRIVSGNGVTLVDRKMHTREVLKGGYEHF
ncbi:thiamine-monophosphate kinase [Spirochaetota bacterium]|nr:thiamine-monophosphate kinase [Spirochaetota bacterium]